MPREFPDTNQVEMSGRVDKADYEEFIGRFPFHGATTWFVRTALKNFLAECQAHPEQEEIIREAMQTTVLRPFSL